MPLCLVFQSLLLSLLLLHVGVELWSAGQICPFVFVFEGPDREESPVWTYCNWLFCLVCILHLGLIFWIVGWSWSRVKISFSLLFLSVFPFFNFPCSQSYDDVGFKRQQHGLCPGFASSLLVRSTLSGLMVTVGTDLPRWHGFGLRNLNLTKILPGFSAVLVTDSRLSAKVFDGNGHSVPCGFQTTVVCKGPPSLSTPFVSLALWATFLLSRSKFVSYFGENFPEERLITCFARGCVESTLPGHFFQLPWLLWPCLPGQLGDINQTYSGIGETNSTIKLDPNDGLQ